MCWRMANLTKKRLLHFLQQPLSMELLKKYIVKGFAMNDDLLKRAGGGNYFDELLARIRDIRSSEKVFYRKVLEISKRKPTKNTTNSRSVPRTTSRL